MQIPMMESPRSAPAAAASPRWTERRAARRAAERGRRAGPGVLWPRRQQADGHRRQPGARAAGRRPLPRRRDAARRAAAERAIRRRRRAARHRCRRGGRRHPAHRRHQDVIRGERRLDRARARCRRVSADRLWRRRAAARGRDRPRDRHGRIIIPRAPGHFCAFGMLSPISATTSCVPVSRLENVPFEEIESAFGELVAQGRKPSRSGVPPPRSARL